VVQSLTHLSKATRGNQFSSSDNFYALL